jgi:hypothetical protein
VTEPLDLYDNVYADFTSGAEGAVRRETYGEDIGQSSWLTAGEWLRFAEGLHITAGSDVLEVGSGSGGPAIYLAERLGCRVTGVDINENGVRNAVALAQARGVGERASFQAVDASRRLPFPPGTTRGRDTATRWWPGKGRPTSMASSASSPACTRSRPNGGSRGSATSPGSAPLAGAPRRPGRVGRGRVEPEGRGADQPFQRGGAIAALAC